MFNLYFGAIKKIFHVGKCPYLGGQNEVLVACNGSQLANQFKWILNFFDENFGPISLFLWKFFYIA